MKTTLYLLRSFLIIGLLLAVPTLSQGQPLVYDDFESYTSGETLNGDNGGVGWSNAWSASTVSASVVNNSLAYSGGDISLSGGSQAMAQGLSGNADNTTAQTNRSFSPYTAGTDTVYFSFLIESPTLAAPGSNDFLSVWLNGDSDFGMIVRDGGDIRARASTNIVSSGTTLTADETFLAVIKLSSTGASPGTVYDRTDVFINPTTLTEPVTATVSATTSLSTISSISSVGVRFALFDDVNDVAYLDNFVVSRNWNDAVTTIPEPTPMAPLALVLGALLFLRSARRKEC